MDCPGRIVVFSQPPYPIAFLEAHKKLFVAEVWLFYWYIPYKICICYVHYKKKHLSQSPPSLLTEAFQALATLYSVYVPAHVLSHQSLYDILMFRLRSICFTVSVSFSLTHQCSSNRLCGTTAGKSATIQSVLVCFYVWILLGCAD